MSMYAGLSLREIYERKCDEMSCKKNSFLLSFLPNKPDVFDLPQSIDISKNFLGPKGIRPLFEVIRCCTNLKYLDLRDQQLTKETIDDLYNVLFNHPTVIRINLSDNPLTIASGTVLAELAKQNSVIEQIILENTQVRPVMCNAIAAQLAKNRLAKQAAMQAVEEATQALRLLEDEPSRTPSSSSAKPNATLDPTVTKNLLASFPHTVAPFLFDDNPVAALTQLATQSSSYFTDTQFLPDEVSIQRVESANYKVKHWKRISELSPHPKIFPDDNNIQMPIECKKSFSWVFVSLMASMDPLSIRAMITPQKFNPYGVYTVKFFVDGTWRYVVVDDFLPLNETDGFSFCSPADDVYYWPCIVEKAVAKLHASYQAIDSNIVARHPSERTISAAATMTDFSGGVGISRDLHHEEFHSEEWWATLLELHRSNAALVATSGADESSLAAQGIEQRHAYHILHVRQINGFRLLHLSSQWATRTWQGDWSSKSPLWDQHSAIAEALEIKKDSSDSFWIPYVKFLQYFAAVHICRTFPGVNNRVVEGCWSAEFCGGPFFDQSWAYNPRFKLSFAERGPAFINLCLPDMRFSQSDVETLAFHVLRGESYPLKFEKEDVVAKTSYVITNSVSFDGNFNAGDFWLVPSTYVPGKAGRFSVRIFSTAPFVLRFENIRSHWNDVSHQEMIEDSGEYQNGEDNAQFALEFPQNAATDGSGSSGKVLIKLHTPETDQLSLALFLVEANDRTRLIGPIPEDKILARSKFVISNTVYLEAFIPSNASRYMICTCVNPEHSRTPIVLTTWSSIQKFQVVPLPIWPKKSLKCAWQSSGVFQEALRNPQIEFQTSQPNTTFVVQMQVRGAQDPSIVFFVVGNRDRVGEGLRGKIPEERILCRSTYIRHESVVKEFKTGAVPLNSYLIIPCLLPPGSSGECLVTVSSPVSDFNIRLVDNGVVNE